MHFFFKVLEVQLLLSPFMWHLIFCDNLITPENRQLFHHSIYEVGSGIFESIHSYRGFAPVEFSGIFI